MLDWILFILLLVSWLCSFAMLTVYNTHMFQLNSYKPHEQRAWYRDKFLPAFVGRNLGVIFTLPLLCFCGRAGIVLSIFLYAVTAYLGRPRKAKKPLVYTARVKRMLATDGVLTALTLLAAILLHRWPLGWGLLLPVAHFVAGFYLLAANWLNKPIEKSINNRYINDAKRMIDSSPNLKVVGITGSYGKTSVKFFLRKLLSARYNVLMTPESYNTTMGVVKTIRNSLRPTHEIFLCEMGARNIGDIKEICDIVSPRYGIITSIGRSILRVLKPSTMSLRPSSNCGMLCRRMAPFSSMGTMSISVRRLPAGKPSPMVLKTKTVIMSHGISPYRQKVRPLPSVGIAKIIPLRLR